MRFALGLALLSLASWLIAHSQGIRLGWEPLIAITRAALQLSLLALILSGVLHTPWLVAGFVCLMLVTASATSMHRLRDLYRGRQAAALGVLLGAVISLGAIFALRLLAWEVRPLVAAAGIIIGNSMSAATLAGRNFHRLTVDRRDELEGWLSLGARPAFAHAQMGRESIRESVIPNLDQTRNSGLVTLPGAFVGAIMGGASPALAAQFQLVVLAGIVLAMLVTGTVVTRMAGRSPTVPLPPDEAAAS